MFSFTLSHVQFHYTLMIKIGESIRKARLVRNYTQQYMANKLGISVHAYLNIENGRADVNTRRLCNIASVLEYKPYELLLETEK